MKEILVSYFEKIKVLNNAWQLAAFVIASILLVIFFVGSGFLIKTLSIIGLLTAVLFFWPFYKEYLRYREHKDWTKRTIDSLSSQDSKSSPAYVASAGIERQKGKKQAYEHIISEIKKIKFSGKNNKLDVLENMIKGALDSINVDSGF